VTEPDLVVRLIGVYDADHTMRGELRYWVGARLGRAHCALCDVTHGVLRARRTWKEYRAGLPVPFDTYHRDDQPHATRALGSAPFVAAETTTGLEMLLTPDALDACAGSLDALVSAIEAAVAARGLRWPGPPTVGPAI
jgi:hypothetical protein